jgi:general secretion pathway protein G
MMMLKSQVGRAGRKKRESSGFTLIELMIVIAIISILMAIAVGNYQQTIVHAREAALRSDLFEIRKAIQNYTLDKGAAPTSLDDLKSAEYLREIPTDPVTRQKDWITDPCDTVLSADQSLGGICDVHSASDNVSPFNNEPYSSF